MAVLATFSFVLAGIVFGMGAYIKSHPPEVSARGVLFLKRGLQLGAASSTAIFLLYAMMLYRPPVSPSLFWPLALIALAGNVLNLISLAYCLRVLSGESLFTATLVSLGQVLWILFALRAITVDF